MIRYGIYSFLVFVFLISCNNGNDLDGVEGGTLKIDSIAKMEENNLKLDTIVLHKFSDNNSLDTFSLSLLGTGTSDEDSNVNLKIRNRVLLYEINFNAQCLIPYEAFKDTSHSAMVEMMAKGFHGFFNEENFFKPAIDPSVSYDEDNSIPDVEEWKYIQRDTSAIAFKFKQLDETIKMIVYFRRNKKVTEFNP